MADKITFAGLIKNSIYKDRDVIHSLVPPTGMVHRTEQRNELVMELAPILMNSAVSCVFVYGNPGTGKTSMVSQLLEELSQEAQNSDIGFTKVYVNCSENRTETTILIDILSQLNTDKEYPRIGWTRAKALKEFNEVLVKLNTNVLCVLDEVDYALKESGDDILYRLSRINKEGLKSKVSTLLISNDVRVSDYIKPKTASAMGRVKIIFSPYSAEELKDILKERADKAFIEGAISEAVMSKIADIESSRGGDARKALELLDACGKIAISKKAKKVTLDMVSDADTSLEKDSVLGTLATLTKQQKLLYLAMLGMKKSDLESTKVYEAYVETSEKQNIEPLGVRSVRTFLVNFDELGLIESEVTWLKDLNRKTRKITLNVDTATAKKARKMIRDTI